MRSSRLVTLLSYAGMNFAKHAFWAFFSVFGLVYLTDVVRLPAGLAGGLLFVSLVFDAATDLPAGAVLDQVRSRLRDYGPVILAGAAGCALGVFAFFGAAAFGAGPAQAGLIFAILLAFRLAFTVYDLADNALASRITADPHGRTRLAAARKAAAAGATLLIGAIAGWVLQGGGAHRFLWLAGALGLGMAVLAAFAYLPLRAADRAAPAIRVETVGVRWRALRGAGDAWMLTGATLLEAAATPMLTGGLIYYSAAAFGSPAWAGTAIMVMTIAQVVSQFLWLPAARALGKRRALQAAHILGAAAAAAFALLAPAGPMALLAAVFALGAAGGGVSTMRWSLAPDVVDRAQARSGVRAEGGVLSLLSASVQIGSGLAAGALGLGLAALGYGADQPPPAAQDIALLIAAPVALAHLGCVALLARWRFPEAAVPGR